MDTIKQQLLTKISQRVREIEEDYPELQKYLDETRTTLPKNNGDSEIHKKDLEDYLNSLNSLVDNYEEEHKKPS